jgi:hypothetical protein
VRKSQFYVIYVAQATELELSINGSKCAILLFGKQKTKETIEIDNATVKIAENYRYLGITIDRHLHFELHVKKLHTALQRRLNLLKYIAGVKWGGHPKVLNILYKNFIRSKMVYGTTAYGNAPKPQLQKLGTLQNACLRVIEGKHNSNPRSRRTWMTGKEVVKSLSLNIPLGMTIRKLLETHDTTSTAKFNLMEKNSFENQTPC